MPEPVNFACGSPRKRARPTPGRSLLLSPQLPLPRGLRAPQHRLAAIGIAAALAVSLAGCAKMDVALGQQWMVVQFNPNTAARTARQVAKACSHVPNLRLAPIQLAGANSGIVESVQYNATNASDANMAELQTCLQRFPSVQSVGLQDAGDSG